MTDKTCWESVKAEGSAVLEKLAAVIREGNVRRVRIRQGERTIAEFPLTAGVVGALLAPALAGIGAIVALVGECTIRRPPSRRLRRLPHDSVPSFNSYQFIRRVTNMMNARIRNSATDPASSA